MDADKQRALLQVTAHEAALIREMCQTEGFKILEKKFDDKLKKATSWNV